MNQESELYRAAEARAQAAADAPRIGRDPVADARAAEDAAVAKLTAEVKGADAELDTAIRDLHALGGLAAGELATIERLRPVAPEAAASRARKVADEAERRLAVQLRAADLALESARERIVATLLPEPAPDLPAQLKREELGMLLKAAKVDSSPTVAFETIYRDRAKAGDRAGIANLLSSWGRATYLANGGDERGWEALRRAIAVRAAEGPLKESPVAERLRRLYGPSAGSATSAAKLKADEAVKALRKRVL